MHSPARQTPDMIAIMAVSPVALWLAFPTINEYAVRIRDQGHEFLERD